MREEVVKEGRGRTTNEGKSSKDNEVECMWVTI